jgi:hypothetical protein
MGTSNLTTVRSLLPTHLGFGSDWETKSRSIQKYVKIMGPIVLILPYVSVFPINCVK